MSSLRPGPSTSSSHSRSRLCSPRPEPTPTASRTPTTRISCARAARRTPSSRRCTASTSTRFPTTCVRSRCSGCAIRLRRRRNSLAAASPHSPRRPPIVDCGVCRIFLAPECLVIRCKFSSAATVQRVILASAGSRSSGGGFRPRLPSGLERVRDREGRPRSFPVRPPAVRNPRQNCGELLISSVRAWLDSIRNPTTRGASEMAKTRVGINGFGRIGRNFLRAQLQHGGDFEIVAANDIGDTKTMAHLLKHDSVLGPLDVPVEAGEGVIRVDGREIKFLSERDPADLPWADLGVEIAIESTGLFTKRPDAEKHLQAGAKKVVISAPATDPDLTIVLGVNDNEYDPEQHHIVSNASCTTNCVAPVAKILHEAYTIERGFMTTIHAYTNDQQTLDLPHKDLRRARAAAINLIPTSTGAARAIGVVLPELKGKVDGMSVRAPVPTGSVTDLVVQLTREAGADEVNELFCGKADTGDLEGILLYTDEPIVSSDIVHSSYSSIFDSGLTMANGPLVKVFSWYDNEWGYSCRLVDLVAKIGQTLPAAVAA